jgi:hypothetical protein
LTTWLPPRRLDVGNVGAIMAQKDSRSNLGVMNTSGKSRARPWTS